MRITICAELDLNSRNMALVLLFVLLDGLLVGLVMFLSDHLVTQSYNFIEE